MRIITLIILFTSLNVNTEEVNDPLEDLNRKTYEFNEKLDSTILKPTAELYSKFPPKVKQGVTNFFNNLEEIDTSVNQLLQGKPKKSLNDLTRFVINSTIGIGGLFDVASKMGLERHEEDFGQTLAVWGVPEGPYIMLPF
jgi:phospholipid-binding lipoprotein MlaA